MNSAYVVRKGETTKDTILNALATDWPLSVKKLCHAVKNTGKSLTYQAVYKAINEMLDEGVLSKQDSQYMISSAWVQSTGEFINKLAEAYELRGVGTARKLQELNFDSWGDTWDFLLSKMNTGFFGESDEAYVQIRRLFLVPISKEHINELKEFFSRKKVHIMCRGNSPIDKMVAGFLSSLGAHVITGIECARPTSVIVYGNSVVNFYVTGAKERTQLNSYYARAKNMIGAKTGLFNLYRKMRIKLIVNRDSEVLGDVLEQTKAILSKKSH